MVPVQDLEEAAGADRTGGEQWRGESDAAADHPAGRDTPADDCAQHADGDLARYPATTRPPRPRGKLTSYTGLGPGLVNAAGNARQKW